MADPVFCPFVLFYRILFLHEKSCFPERQNRQAGNFMDPWPIGCACVTLIMGSAHGGRCNPRYRFSLVGVGVCIGIATAFVWRQLTCFGMESVERGEGCVVLCRVPTQSASRGRPALRGKAYIANGLRRNIAVFVAGRASVCLCVCPRCFALLPLPLSFRPAVCSDSGFFLVVCARHPLCAVSEAQRGYMTSAQGFCRDSLSMR